MLLDTSGLFCRLHGREAAHERACNEYRRPDSQVTHSLVLAELFALANARGVPQLAVLGFSRDLLAKPGISTIWPGESLVTQAIAFLSSRHDRGYSLCDAVSFVMMRQRGVRDALTTDRHFDQKGFRRLLA